MQDNLVTSSNEVVRFMPKERPTRPHMVAANTPISSCKLSLIMMLRWLSRLMRMMLSDWVISSRSC